MDRGVLCYARFMDPQGIRDYVQRDWSQLEKLKAAGWLAKRARQTPADALRTVDELRRWVRMIRPDFPTPMDRREDLESHMRLSRLFRKLDQAGVVPRS